MGSVPSAEAVVKDVDLTRKVIVITGATSGIGQEAARVFVKKGARVIIASRNMEKMEKTKELISCDNCGTIECVKLDLSSQKSCVQAAKEIHDLTNKVDVLLANAGLFTAELTRTVDGYETMFGTNHLGHFTFTLSLMDLLRKSESAEGGRVVVVSSCAHWLIPRGMRLDDLSYYEEPESWSQMYGYQQSKLANAIFASELERRERALHSGSKVHAFSLHPGAVPTNLAGSSTVMEKVVTQLVRLFGSTIEQGAATSVMCATAPLRDLNPGGYHHYCGKSYAFRTARDASTNVELWRKSLYMTDAPRSAAREQIGDTYFDKMLE